MTRQKPALSIVIGSNGRIGLNAVKAFLEKGNIVIGLDIHERSSASENHSRYYYLSGDFSQVELHRKLGVLLDEIIDEYSFIDCIVNLARIPLKRTEQLSTCENEVSSAVASVYGITHLIDYLCNLIKLSNTARMLSKYLNVFQELDFYYKLRSIFGKIILAGEDIIIPEEFYWRLVRPNNPSDVGPLHADAWFWDLRQEKPPINKVRVKVWIPLYSEPGISGLKYSEGSHRKNYPYIGEMRDGMTKPLPCFNINEVPATTFDGKPGQAIIFNDYLLHGGIVGGTLTRVSIEFYILAETTTIQNRLRSNPN